ncbi:MAG: VWA domain-containing protein [Pseudomonadota bacterium]
MTLPAGVRPFTDFASLLRAHGFAVAPDQTILFLDGLRQLGPRSITDVYRAARALFAIPKEREDEFDALFRAHFLGQTVAAEAEGQEDSVEAREAAGQDETAEMDEAEDRPGDEASVAERLGQRDLASPDAEAKLRRSDLPTRRSLRHAPAKRGRRIDLHRTLRAAARTDGEALTLNRLKRQTRERRMVVLIDVSGSMAEHTEGALRFAHALVQTAERADVFTLATRLTRITPALRPTPLGRALEATSRLVADIDGGTRLGPALAAFLSVPRYAGLARGAAVLILSDGLERGAPDELVEAVRRLSRLAWRLDWLSPLASETGFRPETQALRAILPDLDALVDGSTPERLAAHVKILGTLR